MVLNVEEQILNGLKNLASMGFEHGALTCKSILIGTNGSIKIGTVYYHSSH
jgi:hypothetical protein